MMAAAIRILYVDDEASLLDIGKLFLEGSGEFTVTTALSAPEGIRLLEQEQFDAIISDYQMPGMDGIQFLIEVRSRFGPIPFILFTGRGREEIVIQAINSGADFYLQKGGEPVAQFAELSHKVKSAAKRKRSDDALRESEEKYRSVVEDQTEFVCRFLPDGTHIFINDAYCRYFGIAREDIVGHRFNPVLFSDDRKQIAAFLATLTPEKSTGTIDHRIILPDGTIHWQRWSDRAIFDTDGKVVQYQSVGRDITEQKRVEHALRESEEKLAAIVAGSPVPKFVIDSDHRIIYWNRALEQVTGISASQVIGTREQWRAFYPDERPTMADLILDEAFDRISELYAGKFRESPVVSGAFEATDFFPHMGEKGTYLRFMAASIKNNDGVTLGAVETLIDVSDIKQAEVELGMKNDELLAANEEIIATEEELRANLDELTRQEQALRESEEKYHTVADFAYDWEYWIAPDGNYIYISPSCERITGYRPEEFMLNSNLLITITHSDDRDGIIDHFFHKERDIGDKDILEFRIISRTGEERWIGHKCQSVYDRNGKYLGNRGSNRDITKRKRAEEAQLENAEKLYAAYEELTAAEEELRGNLDELSQQETALRESKKELELTLDATTDGIWKWDFPTNLLEFSPRYYTMLGYQQSEFAPTFESWLNLIHPDDRKNALFVTETYLATKPDTYENEFRLRTKSGEYRWIHASARVVERDSSGAALRMIGNHQDITERKQVVEILKARERSYRTLAENLQGIVYRIHIRENGRMQFFNNMLMTLTGFNEEELVEGMICSIDPLIVAEDRDRIIAEVNTAIKDNRDFSIEYRITHKDGNPRFFIEHGRPIFDDDGLYCIDGIIQDITERKRAEEALHQANRKLNLLSSITRHDISNQLTELQGYLRILEKKQPDSTLNEYFLKVSAAAQRIFAMIQFTKEYEQIGVNAPVWQDCRTLVDTAAKQAPPGQVMIKNDLPVGAGIFADQLIGKVFYNLLDNAVRYGGKITTIQFSVEERDGDHLIVCEDDGEGVVVKEKEMIFEQGFGKNTGLGLAHSREILDITGITIKETGEPGKGARFEIHVPNSSYRMKQDIRDGKEDKP